MSHRWDETWHRLREWTNGQGPSERLAAQILLDDGYKSLDPSHPLGGPDGGKDAVCHLDGRRWVMAVYFPRGQHTLGTIRRKFLDDLEGIVRNAASGIAFVTNQELVMAERQVLSDEAKPLHVDLFHLDRITTVLDKPSMSQVRRQFLGIDGPPDAGICAEVIPLTNCIAGQADGMLLALAKEAGIEIDPETIGLPEIERMCKSVAPHSTAPLISHITPAGEFVSSSWIGYLWHWRQRSAQFDKDLRVFSPFLEPKHVRLVARVEQCSYFAQLAPLTGVPLRNRDLSWIASPMWDYVQRARELKAYARSLTPEIEV